MAALNTTLADIPSDVRDEISARCSFRGVVALSQVCRAWRVSCITASNFWLTIRVCNTDLKHLEVFRSFFERSKGRPLCLVMDFSIATTSAIQFRRFMVLVAQHIERCHQIWICATPDNSAVMKDVFQGKTYPDPYWLSFDLLAPGAEMRRGWHDDSDAERALPWLDAMHITEESEEELLTSSGQLNPWMLCASRQLELRSVDIPHIVAGHTAHIPFTPSVTHLILSNVRSTLREDDVYEDELDCMPFFEALRLPKTQYLEIDGLEPESRLWNDYIGALGDEPRYPELTHLVFRNMQVAAMPEDTLVSLLQSTPNLDAVLEAMALPGVEEDRC
ncbi:hypothetical protein C8J57DRAFT_1513851 [Mycena rebaudengoi]|nr:hypothetical protein C8J57DRAFT_1513851 [Mycena rebaudengoi]